jgi:predicted amidohydrolase YtcJ
MFYHHPMKQLFHNGQFYTGTFETNPTASDFASAILVEDGIITQLIKNPTELSELQPRVDEAIDCRGQWVLPAFEDAHNHPGSHSRIMLECDLRETKMSWQEAVYTIQQYISKQKPGDWIVVHGWNSAQWPGLSKTELDTISTEHPIILADQSYHSGVCNSRAFEWLRQEQPAIQMSEQGILEEASFETAFDSTAPEPEVYARAVKQFQLNAAQLGIGSMHELEVRSQQQLAAFAALESSGEAFMDVPIFITPAVLGSETSLNFLQQLLEEQQTWKHTRIIGLKLVIDGSFGSYTAALAEPYDNRNTRGVVRTQPDEIARSVVQAEQLGLTQVAMHCIGDIGIETALTTIEFLKPQHPTITVWRLEHVELPSNAQIERAKALDVVFCFQPSFLWDALNYADRLGERVHKLMPLQSVIQHQLQFVFGSDDQPTGPISGIDWVTRRAPSPGQQVSRLQALRASIIDPPKLLSDTPLGSNRGQLQVGYKATMMLFENDVFHVTDEVFTQLHPSSVYIEGLSVAR